MFQVWAKFLWQEKTCRMEKPKGPKQVEHRYQGKTQEPGQMLQPTVLTSVFTLRKNGEILKNFKQEGLFKHYLNMFVL